MAKVRIGLIGVGRIARLVHVPVLRGIEDAEVVAIAESDPGARLAAKDLLTDAAVFSDYRDLLSGADIDAAVICLPPALHAECAIAALRSGRHVYLEKPVAGRFREAADVVNAWRQSGLIGMIGFNYRYHPAFTGARGHLESGSLGDLIAATSVFSARARTVPEWKRQYESGGGVMLDLASHDVDLVHFLFDQRILRVSAVERSQRYEADTAVLRMELESGLPVQSVFSMHSTDEHRFEIYGAEAKLTINRAGSSDLRLTGTSRQDTRLTRLANALRDLQPGRFLRSPGYEPSYRAALRSFVESVKAGQSAGPDLAAGLRSLAVVERAIESARLGRVLDVDQGIYE